MNEFNPFRPSDPGLAELLNDFPTREHTGQPALMDEEEVARALQLAEIGGIPVVVDGGWAGEKSNDRYLQHQVSRWQHEGHR